jgi:hypothetical protein
MGDQPVPRLLPTRRTTQTQNKLTQTSMPRVGFEPAIPVFERAKTVHALDRAATVIGITLALPRRKHCVAIAKTPVNAVSGNNPCFFCESYETR